MSNGLCLAEHQGPLKYSEVPVKEFQILSETGFDRVAEVTDPVPESKRSQESDDSNDEEIGQNRTEKLKTVADGLFLARKRRMIERALSDNSTAGLKTAAVDEGGLLCDHNRRLIWPRIGGVSVYETSARPSMDKITGHAYYSQVVLDVKRSLKRFPPSIAECQRIALQDKLVVMIMRVLMKNPELHYYQGYHDICVTILLVLGEEVGFLLVDKLSCTNLRRFMDKTMIRTSDLLEHIYLILGHENPELRDFLERAQVGIMFCLSWVITWFGHVLADYDTVVRLFDLFLSSHPWMPVYLSAAIVLHAETRILALDCDLAPVHCFLSHLIEEDLPFESLILRAQCLLEQHPPSELQAEMAVYREQRRWILSQQQQAMARRRRSRLWRCAHYAGALVAGTGTWKGALTLAALLLAICFQAYRKNMSLAWF